jgi:hypothetical protein
MTTSSKAVTTSGSSFHAVSVMISACRAEIAPVASSRKVFGNSRTSVRPARSFAWAAGTGTLRTNDTASCDSFRAVESAASISASTCTWTASTQFFCSCRAANRSSRAPAGKDRASIRASSPVGRAAGERSSSSANRSTAGTISEYTGCSLQSGSGASSCGSSSHASRSAGMVSNILSSIVARTLRINRDCPFSITTNSNDRRLVGASAHQCRKWPGQHAQQPRRAGG